MHYLTLSRIARYDFYFMTYLGQFESYRDVLRYLVYILTAIKLNL